MSIIGNNENVTHWDPELALKDQLAIFPDDVLLWTELGNHQLDLGRFDEAKESFMHCMDFDPTSIEVLKRLVYVNVRLGEYRDVKELEFLLSELIHNKQGV